MSALDQTPPHFIAWAKEGYDAYGAVTDHKNYQGLPMPKWDELPPKIQEAWVAGARAVAGASLFQSMQGVAKMLPGPASEAEGDANESAAVLRWRVERIIKCKRDDCNMAALKALEPIVSDAEIDA